MQTIAKHQPKVIQYSNPAFWINLDLDPDVCRIAPKMLCCPQYRENRPVTVLETLIKVLKSLSSQWWGKWKSDLESVVLPIGRLNHKTKFHWNWLLTFAVILQIDRQTDRIADRQTWSRNLQFGGGYNDVRQWLHCLVLTLVCLVPFNNHDKLVLQALLQDHLVELAPEQ